MMDTKKTEAELNAEAAAAAREREGTRLIYKAPCPVCKTNQYVKIEPEYYGFLAYCDNCYDVDCTGDPMEFVSLRPVYHALTSAQALQEWNEHMGVDNE